MVEDDLYLPVGNGHRVWLREISEETFDEQKLHGLDNDCGLFLAIEDLEDGSMSVVAKAPDAEIGRTLLQLVASGLAANLCASTGSKAIRLLPAMT